MGYILKRMNLYYGLKYFYYKFYKNNKMKLVFPSYKTYKGFIDLKKRQTYKERF